MNRTRTATWAGLSGTTALAVLACSQLVAAPAAHAATFAMPAPTVAFTAASQGNPTTTGAYAWLGTDTTLQALVGTTLIGSEGAVTLGDGQLADGRTLTWYSCSTRGASLAGCTSVRSQSVAAASASGTTFTYTPTADDAGRFLAYEVTQKIATIAGSVTRTAVSDRAKDVQVVAGLATTARPAWGISGVQAGGKASLLLFPWTLPAGSTFTGRSLTTFACPSAGQGQEPTATWNTSGCMSIPASSVTGGTVNLNAASAFQVQTTADMAGRTLVAQVIITTKTANGFGQLYSIRSAGATLPAPVAAAAPVAPSAPAADTAAAAAPTASAPSIVPATAIVPTVRIVAVRSIARGRSTIVAIQLTGRGKGTIGSGRAIVHLVKKGVPGERAVQRLTTTTISGMKGFSRQTLSKKLAKGTYYLRVIYTDSRSHVQAGALKRISVR